MMKTLRGGVLTAAMALVAGPAVSAQSQAVPPARLMPPPPAGLPGAWWKSQTVRAELGLTEDQTARIDRIWKATRPELQQEWDELSRYEGKLSKLIQADADEAVLSRQIDRVETARATANKTRSVMLVQMLKTLTPEQRTRFYAIHDRFRAESFRTPSTGDPRPRPEN